MKKVLLYTLGVLVVIIVGLIIFINLTWEKTYDAPFPDLAASTDSTLIERGRHLVYGPAHCATCHMPGDKIRDIDNGAQYPLAGGWEFDIPPAIVRAPNLTPDETGIANLSDGEIARAMRYSVNHKGHFMMPFMPFQELSDEDVIAIISFLRSQEPVKNEVAPTEYKFLGKALLAMGAIEPMQPVNPIPKSVPHEPTAEYGKYIANSVANCVGCHTERDLKTGDMIGVPFAGGFAMPPEPFTQGYSFVTPNLTPEKETGVMALWTEDMFVQRFQKGRIIEYSPMPWGVFREMDEIELKALYAYLHTLEPTVNKVGKTVYEPGEELPQ